MYPDTNFSIFCRGRREFQRVLRQQRRSLLTRDIQAEQLDVQAIAMFVNVFLVSSLSRRGFFCAPVKVAKGKPSALRVNNQPARDSPVVLER